MQIIMQTVQSNMSTTLLLRPQIPIITRTIRTEQRRRTCLLFFAHSRRAFRPTKPSLPSLIFGKLLV